MPFYEAVGRDNHSFQPRTLQISARDDREAIDTASLQGITDIKLRPYSDREMLMLDFKCFLNASNPAPSITRSVPNPSASLSYRPSLLLDHPLLTITSAVLLALMLNRALDLIIATL